MIKYIICLMLIILIVLFIVYFAVPESKINTEIKVLEEDIELMDRLTTALQDIMDDIDSSLEWNRRANQKRRLEWTEIIKK